MPLHPDFRKMRENMVDEYGEDKGERVFYAYINKHRYDDTKSLKYNTKNVGLKMATKPTRTRVARLGGLSRR